MPVSVGQTPPDENDVYRYYGTQLLHSLLAGGAMGAGGMGIWRMVKNHKDEQARKLKKQQSLTEVAAAPPSFIADKMANDSLLNALALPLSGAGAGALFGALTAEKGQRRKKMLQGGLVGGGAGAVGAGLASGGLAEFVGKSIPDEVSDVIPFGRFFPSEKYTAKSPVYQASAYLLPIAAGSAGVYGGARAVDSLMGDDKKEKQVDEVQSARDSYFKTLLNEPEENDEEKKSFHDTLDSFYEKYEEKIAANDWGGWLQEQANYWSNPFQPNPQAGPFDKGPAGNTVQNILTAPALLSGAALLGGGALGAKYMYDKTRESSKAKLLQAAQEAKERLRGLDTPWIDPTELASIKELAKQEELTSARGM
jgi:hypothetical protein